MDSENSQNHEFESTNVSSYFYLKDKGIQHCVLQNSDYCVFI